MAVPKLRPAIATGDETTPLLAEAGSIDPMNQPTRENDSLLEREPRDDEEEEKPLDKKQIFLLCYTAVVEPVAFFGIFPYINFMIERVGHVKQEDVGFYSGLIESLFSVTQMCVMLFWGKVGNHTHRSPTTTLAMAD